jgi:hypothetical protein
VLSNVSTCARYAVTLAWLAEALPPWIGGPVAYQIPIGTVRLGELLLGLGGAIALFRSATFLDRPERLEEHGFGDRRSYSIAF